MDWFKRDSFYLPAQTFAIMLNYPQADILLYFFESVHLVAYDLTKLVVLCSVTIKVVL